MTDNVIFDMDGVLFDSERLYAKAWAQVALRLQLPDIDACISYCVGRNGKDIRAYLLEKFGPEFEAEAFGKEIAKAFQQIIDAEGLPLKVGVIELLDWLQDHNVKCALATSSGHKSAQQHLQQADLTRYFEAIVTGDMITHGKPDPDIYLFACDKLGTKPENTYAIEDSPNGVKSAHAAGMKVIMVPDLIEPTAELERLLFKKFTSLLEVKSYFESVLL